MSQFSSDEVAKYVHSPVHYAVARKDYAAVRRIISALPRLAKAGEIRTETDAIAEEHRAEALSAVIDRRDVPGRETPLHLAVRMGDTIAAEILMSAGADWSLQNEHGWSALQEAICAREEAIAMIIMRYYQPLAWAKWCRRLPRVIGTMQRMRDFYMEVTFHFESSVIPFIGRIAPSDTYRIWKQGSNFRADMTLAGFDGFKIQRSDQSFVFLGEGSADGKLSPGCLCMLNHKDKEIMDALEGAGTQPSEAEIVQEVTTMSQTNMYRPGIDVTQAVLVPQISWRRHEKIEMVGGWKAKLYEMHNVMVSVKSRRVPGAMTDEELFGSSEMDGELEVDESYTELLTEEEKQQLDLALKMEGSDVDGDRFDDGRSHFGNMNCTSVSSTERDDAYQLTSASGLDMEGKDDKKGWFGWGRRSVKEGSKEAVPRKMVPPRSSLCVENKVSNLLGEEDLGRGTKLQRGRRSVDARLSNARAEEAYMLRKDRDGKKLTNKDPARKRRVTPNFDGSGENEYKKGLRPILWLTPNFPLRTEELLPLLDILANKVKAVRRLREILTTKLPGGTFPVKVAIPVIPTIRVIVTFTKFEELHSGDDFVTPPSSPSAKGKDVEASKSWFAWIKGSASKVSGMAGVSEDHRRADLTDPFAIPNDYVWTSMDAKKQQNKGRKMKKKGRKSVQHGGTEPGSGHL